MHIKSKRDDLEPIQRLPALLFGDVVLIAVVLTVICTCWTLAGAALAWWGTT